MRVSERQARVLRAAADLGGETLTGFVLAVATERAEEVLERAQRIDLGAEAFERFVAALDAPAEMPTLRRYAGKRGPIPSLRLPRARRPPPVATARRHRAGAPALTLPTRSTVGRSRDGQLPRSSSCHSGPSRLRKVFDNQATSRRGPDPECQAPHASGLGAGVIAGGQRSRGSVATTGRSPGRGRKVDPAASVNWF